MREVGFGGRISLFNTPAIIEPLALEKLIRHASNPSDVSQAQSHVVSSNVRFPDSENLLARLSHAHLTWHDLFSMHQLSWVPPGYY